MCGIVGYVGSQKAKPILINGLQKLEYRGYDSAGVSTLEGNVLSNVKTVGRVSALDTLPEINNLEGTIGIAHTRWATHGKPSTTNSHPHLDNSKNFAVVHNGIIENYNELRHFLQNEGYLFLSETDTEVIPNLIDYYYKQTKDVLKAIQKTCIDLKGSFAIEVITTYLPDTMIVVRKDSPLVIGKGNAENYISSDIPAILSYTREFYLLNDLEFACITKNNIEFFDKNLNKINKEIKTIEWDASAAEKGGYEDYMLKEIFEQPNSIRETLNARNMVKTALNFDISLYNKIYIVACGTAMHAGLACKPVLENLCNISTQVDIASEFRYRNPIIDNKTLAIFISQSGETADTIAALKLAKSKGAKTLAICNVIGSTISREADICIYTHAGPEIAVASTKAYTAQVVLLNIIAYHFAEKLGKQINSLWENLINLPEQIEEILKTVPDKIKNLAKKIYMQKDMFFLGRGIDYTVAQEGSLKLKEISYIHSEAYAAGELKHGPIALIENGITVISILTDESLAEKTISNIQEVATRGASTVVVTNLDISNHKFDELITIPKTNSFISPVLSVIPLQLLSYYISKQKGLDVDKPRNLAKSVTVE